MGGPGFASNITLVSDFLNTILRPEKMILKLYLFDENFETCQPPLVKVDRQCQVFIFFTFSPSFFLPRGDTLYPYPQNLVSPIVTKNSGLQVKDLFFQKDGLGTESFS